MRLVRSVNKPAASFGQRRRESAGHANVARAAIFVLHLLALMTVSPGQATAGSTANIRIEYAVPTDAAHQTIYDRLRQLKVLEYVRELLGSIRLPRPLTITLRSCDGLPNALYAHDVIIVCYELVSEILEKAPKDRTPTGISPRDIIVGCLLDVFLHEAGHAVFDMLKVPLFGREEDAADQFSAYILLQYDKVLARRLILGSAYQYGMDSKTSETTLALKTFSDIHGLPAQRYYNVLCVAYGADPKLFADIVSSQYLPQDRAAACDQEYRQVRFAFKTLIRRHVDRSKARRFFKRGLDISNDATTAVIKQPASTAP